MIGFVNTQSLGAATIVAALFLPSAALAAKGNIEAGKAKAAEFCAACHGEAGVAANPGVPDLAGNMDSFLQWQLVFYRSGRRHNENMDPVVADIADEDIRNLGAYYASLPGVTATSPDPDSALSAAGKAIVDSHHCANCHTDSFLGKSAAARIARQHEEYLGKALADYRSGARPSTGVAAMSEAASGLSDSDIASVAHFLAYLPITP